MPRARIPRLEEPLRPPINWALGAEAEGEFACGVDYRGERRTDLVNLVRIVDYSALGYCVGKSKYEIISDLKEKGIDLLLGTYFDGDQSAYFKLPQKNDLRAIGLKYIKTILASDVEPHHMYLGLTTDLCGASRRTDYPRTVNIDAVDLSVKRELEKIYPGKNAQFSLIIPASVKRIADIWLFSLITGQTIPFGDKIFLIEVKIDT